MRRRFATLLVGLSAAILVWGCASQSAEKSTGTTWLECKNDRDCAQVSGAVCNPDGYCVDRDGNKIPVERVPEAGIVDSDAGASGSGNATAEAGRSAAGGSSNGSGGRTTTTGATGGAGSGGAGGDDNGGAGDSAIGGAGGDDNGGAGGDDNSDAGMPPTGRVSTDCYSPNQKLDQAYEEGAIGCECRPGSPSVCVAGAALVCSEGRWVAVEDGPCSGCWTPDEPELAEFAPDRGCACAEEGATACRHSQFTGYLNAECSNGQWRVLSNPAPCSPCDSDAGCLVGFTCENHECTQSLTVCEVNGVQYTEGTTDIPDPLSCNTCTCEQEGLVCTQLPCPSETACPPNSWAGTICLRCDDRPDQRCGHYLTACHSPCLDCGFGGLVCDNAVGACTAVCR